MKKYNMEDVIVRKNEVEIVQRLLARDGKNVEMFELLNRIVKDLILLKALPIKIDFIDE
jgi:hypothetical protein